MMFAATRIINPSSRNVDGTPPPASYPNPFCPTVASDPFRAYSELRRAHGNVVHVSFGDVRPHSAVTVAVLGLRECQEVLSSPSRFKVHFADRPPRPSELGITLNALQFAKYSMLFREGSDHQAIKNPLLPLFSRHAAAALQGEISGTLQYVLTEARIGERPIDFVQAVARRFPILVMSHILGIEHPLCARICTEVSKMAPALGMLATEADLAWANEGLLNGTTLLNEHADRFGFTPVVEKMTAQLGSGSWSRRDLIVSLGFLLSAGFETTARAVSSLFDALVQRRELRSYCVGEDAMALKLVDEVLRVDPPVHATLRVCQEDTTISGCVVPKGANIIVNLAAANRDPAIFGADADRINPDRSIHHQGVAAFGLAFGHRPHRCLGAEVARREMVALARAFPTAHEEPTCLGAERRFDGTFSGFSHYFVTSV